jgi:uncharacterized protein (DUF2147 family)
MRKILFTLVAVHGLSDPVKGLWEVPQDGTLIEINVKDGVAEGIISSRPGNRTNEIDKYNPIPELRHQPIIGLKVLRDLKSTGEGTLRGGAVYDPDSGSTYRAQAHLEDPDTLVVRGYVGIPLFGRTATLKRFKYLDARQAN